MEVSLASRKNFSGHQITRKKSALTRLKSALNVAKDEGKRERLQLAITNTESNLSKLGAN
jgi:hypothetical protein